MPDFPVNSPNGKTPKRNLLCPLDLNDRIESWFWRVGTVEQEWSSLGAPRNRVIDAPKRNDINCVSVFNKRPKKARVSFSQSSI
jgi:hypothetical protein